MVRKTNTWRLNITFLNNQQVTEEIKREIKKFLETNDNENITTQNLWDAAKAALRGKLIAIQSYLKKQEKHRTDNLILYLKQLEKEEEKNSEVSRRKVKVQVSQSCPTLCSPIDYTVHGILQARILEWVAFPFSRGSSQPRDQTRVSCIPSGFFTSWPTRENQK